MAKHLHDISILLKHAKIQTMCSNQERLEKMVGYKRKEEQIRIGSELAEKPLREFSFFETGRHNEYLIKEFFKMQDIYVFNKEHILSEEDLARSIGELSQYFQ
ncbi:hypothetical protein [Anaerocolumna xylanovorans]|uniref:Uncharacterized protein n=1 Tax=Anaerocolumna xylanovorans DSM 12503 TaxID=1121345 RepID=A0A1M7YNH2_9FIRM|nr:hypothetical protein [Anaerocolumna xylanovorans]SHO54151.1 hypothetical protein SAMN02745217_04606 [Anaerocolumna xylanovorans DSM 12503]